MSILFAFGICFTDFSNFSFWKFKVLLSIVLFLPEILLLPVLRVDSFADSWVIVGNGRSYKQITNIFLKESMIVEWGFITRVLDLKVLITSYIFNIFILRNEEPDKI